MRRRLLLCATALGAVIAVMGGTGIFAVFTDRATTGTNTVTSGARPKAADLQIASTGTSYNDCQTFSEDLATGLVTMTDAQPLSKQITHVCLKNVGASELTLSVKAIDLTDSEAGCTGDEAAAGDTTCGTGAGEISDIIAVNARSIDCATGAAGPIGGQWLSVLPGNPMSLGTVASGAQACARIEVTYAPLNTTANQQLLAQSDTATWRFAFDGATA